jgi:hypothetical protein
MYPLCFKGTICIGHCPRGVLLVWSACLVQKSHFHPPDCDIHRFRNVKVKWCWMCLYFLTCMYLYRYSHSDDVTFLVFHPVSITAHWHNTTFSIKEWFVDCLVCTDLFLNGLTERVALAIMFVICIREMSVYESRPGHQLSSLRLSWFFPVLPRRHQDNIQK